jgi:DNA polymerase
VDELLDDMEYTIEELENDLEYSEDSMDDDEYEAAESLIEGMEELHDNCSITQFQKLVKLSNKFDWVEHNGKNYTYKCYRVFASTRSTDGKINACRVQKKTGQPEVRKFGNTPEQCFIVNDDINDMKCPDHLDKRWYINTAVDRLKDFGVKL